MVSDTCILRSPGGCPYLSIQASFKGGPDILEIALTSNMLQLQNQGDYQLRFHHPTS